MTQHDLQALIDYHYWARDRMLVAVAPLSSEEFTRNLGSSFGSVRDTLSHLHGAEWIWLSRLQETSPTAGLPPHDRFPDLPAVRTAWAETETGIRALVAGLDEASLDRIIEYRLLSGKPMASRTSHMLLHLVNHATYHRGQVTTMLRQLGATAPKSLDLITFYREYNAGEIAAVIE